jgi:hypothetical protein
MISPPPRIGFANERGLLRLGGFGRPFGIGMDPEGRILVADMDLHGIVRFTPDLLAYQWLGDDAGWSEKMSVNGGLAERAHPGQPSRFNGPHSVACGTDGRIYVTTYYDPGLHILSPTGGLVTRIDGEKSLFRFKGPATGLFDARKHLLVTEYALHGIFSFDAEGRFVGALGGGQDGFRQASGFEPGSKAGFFDRPHMAATMKNGDIIVADTWNHRLQRFSPEGRFMGILGGSKEGWRDAAAVTPQSSAPSGFHAPVAVSILEDGRIVVTDWGNNRLKWLDAEGYLLEIDDSLGLEKPYDAQVFGNRCFVANSHRGEIIVKDV